jgi:23S rRNA pseudouridine1911/1915/1917 synthase
MTCEELRLPVETACFTVTRSLAGERLDRSVALLTGLSRAEASRLVGSGGVAVDGVAVTSGSRRLREGEQLELFLPAGAKRGHLEAAGTPREARLAGEEPAGGGAAGAGPRPGPAEPAIVYVDRHLVVVDKPAGLVVHPGAGNPEGTLVQKLLALFPDIAGAGPDLLRPGIVHRLDKGTSGLLVVARTAQAREQLAQQMAARTVVRKYLAVAYGELAEDAGSIEAPLGRSPRDRQKVAVVSGGRPARTHYQVLARSAACFPASLLILRLETGRTHQVRAHLAAIGHAVVGDALYAGRAGIVAARRSLPFLARPWLHAAVLGFVHPASGEEVRFSSEPPPELVRALEVLGFGDVGPAGLG